MIYLKTKGLLKPWSKVVFDNNRMLVDDKTAFAVGRYIFTDYNGSQITVDYSLVISWLMIL